MNTKNQKRILLITGDGKGKTNAALGIAFRAAGHGMKSIIVQFIKSDKDKRKFDSIEGIQEIEIIQVGGGGVPKNNGTDFKQHKQSVEAGLNIAQKAIASGKYQIVILDEICVAVSEQLLSEEHLLEVVRQANEETIIVMTGRNATQGLIDVADTVTEMKNIKHRD